jgi:hypothetical protein
LPLVFAVACAAQPPDRADDDDTVNPGPDAGTEACAAPGATRCSGQEYQTCENGTWTTSQTCSGDETCYNAHGCAQCDPTAVQVCVGNDVYSCSNGTLGGMVQSCGSQTCNGGSCGNTPTDCDESTQVIYVVDSSYNLLSFDPRNDANTFHLIGSLDCPAGTAIDTDPTDQLPPGPATPFSMSVDREGRAWVLYSSGELFFVDTTNASCQPANYTVGAQGFELFGMGFVSDTVGSDAETLFIAGGTAQQSSSGQASLGSIAKGTLATTRIGAMAHAQYSAELTGTGNAELWAYFPGDQSKVAKVDKTSGATTQTYNMPASGYAANPVSGWAFAHYGGRNYVFVSTKYHGIGDPKNQVLRLDPAGTGGQGQVATVVASSPYEVVGAGVSTCAPVVVN